MPGMDGRRTSARLARPEDITDGEDSGADLLIGRNGENMEI